MAGAAHPDTAPAVRNISVSRAEGGPRVDHEEVGSHGAGNADGTLQPAGPPPGYPWEFQRLVTLDDGRRVVIRPILRSDAAGLGEAIRAADADTIRRRFLGGRPQVTPELLDHLTTVDYVTRFALVAIDPASQRGASASPATSLSARTLRRSLSQSVRPGGTRVSEPSSWGCSQKLRRRGASGSSPAPPSPTTAPWQPCCGTSAGRIRSSRTALPSSR